MAERDIRERDILVASNEFAYVQDLTKGDIVLYVGPTKISLSNTERLVEYREGRFLPVRADEPGAGVSSFVAATSSQYIVVENPPKDANARATKGSNSAVELLWGRKIVVAGPAAFALWPGQRARVLPGHELREDEYLVVRVYDAAPGDPLPIGTEIIVRGSDTSFYVPPTGLEVVPHFEAGKVAYVRKARRLRRNMGLHLRVLKPFTAGEGDQVPPGAYAAGQEVFLREREGFFFPTERLEVIAEVEPIVVGDKEGIYVRDLETGETRTELGPQNFLLDPTRFSLADRLVDEAEGQLYGVPPGIGPRAVAVHIPPNHAVLVTAKDRREIARGPRTRILDWGESLEVLALSSGKPKRDESPIRTCFLQIEGNKVSDVVRVKTSDHVELDVSLSYRVSFVTQGTEAERWFQVKDYVGLLCDHAASILRAAARTSPIEAFHARGAEIVRTALLGDKVEAGARAGRLFSENGMWLYDVEVLDVGILDEDVEKLLGEAQRAAITAEIERRREGLRLEGERLRERVAAEILRAQRETLTEAAENEAKRREVSLAKVKTEVEVGHAERLGRARSEAEATALLAASRLEAAAREADLERTQMVARVEAFERQMASLSPELVATLRSLGQKAFAAELSKNASLLAILGGESVGDVVERLLGSLPVGPGPESVASALKGLLENAAPAPDPTPRPERRVKA